MAFCNTGTGVSIVSWTRASTCNSRTMTWTANGNTYSGTIATTSNGSQNTAEDTAINNLRGFATYECNNGSFSLVSGTASCDQSCPSGQVSWGGGNCTDTVSATYYTTRSVTNDASGYTGSGTATCNNRTGRWSVSGTCEADTPTFDCSSGMVDTNCGSVRVGLPNAYNGDSKPITGVRRDNTCSTHTQMAQGWREYDGIAFCNDGKWDITMIRCDCTI